MRTRDEVRTALDRNFRSLMDCLGYLTEEELTEKPVAGSWTVKDVIAHVWDWGDEAVRTAEAWRRPRPWQDGVTYDDAWNEMHVANRRVLPLMNVIEGATGVHRHLIRLADTVDDRTFNQTGRAWWGAEMTLGDLLYEMAEHYAEHAQCLTVFQLECLGADATNDSPC
jgi:hypothetical protein